ncbi:MAG: hypothetical protein WEA29_06110 [Acidimicrobiia bacterium]
MAAGWFLSLYPDAGEAGGSFRGLNRRRPGSGGGWATEPDEGRAVEEAARRARGKVRRYCAANGLNRFGTLTYAGEGEHDPRAVRADISRFFRSLRRGLDEAFPYLWVPELHKSGHGWHVHFAVGRFVARGLIEAAWGLGFVHIKLIGDLPVGSGVRQEARVAARYASKYLSKDIGGTGGLNRYDCAQGFQPASELIFAATLEGAVEAASDRMGALPEVVFRPDQVEGFKGPPAVWLSWR